MTKFLTLDDVVTSNNVLKEAICYDAINNYYKKKIIESNQIRYNLKCSTNTCKWRLNTS